MKIAIPSPQEEALSKNGKFTIAWFTLFSNLLKRVIGEQDGFLGCVINSNVDQEANLGLGATDLMTYELGKGVLQTTGDFLEIEGDGQFAANGNNKSISLLFDSTTIFSISPTAINDGSWKIRAKITRISETSQTIIVEGNGTNSVLIKTVSTATTKDLMSKLIVAFNATGGAGNDILQNSLTIKAFIQ